MPLDTITLATQTTFAELLQRCLDAEVDELYDERGLFTRKRVKGRMYVNGGLISGQRGGVKPGQF